MSRDVAGLAASVRVDGGRELRGTLGHGDRTHLTIVVPVAPRPLTGRVAAVVEYATPLGVHRVHGRLTADPRRAGILRLDRDGGEILQRREWARVDAVRPVRLAVGGDVALVWTRNISAGGMLVQDPLRLAAGEEVGYALHLVDGEPPIAGRGPVTDVRGDDGVVAVRLDGLAEADRERIVRWATERQRHALRTVRRA